MRSTRQVDDICTPPSMPGLVIGKHGFALGHDLQLLKTHQEDAAHDPDIDPAIFTLS